MLCLHLQTLASLLTRVLTRLAKDLVHPLSSSNKKTSGDRLPLHPEERPLLWTELPNPQAGVLSAQVGHHREVLLLSTHIPFWVLYWQQPSNRVAKLDATSQRWVASLEPYSFSVIYRPGVNNVFADALSRQYDNEEDDNTEHLQKWAKDIC